MMLRLIAASLFAVSTTIALPAVASAEPQPPACPKNTVTIGNQGQVITVPQQSQVCDDDPMGGDGLLGNLPVVGNLPGLGGVL